MLGNNAQNISRLERGEASPTLYWKSSLAKVFNTLLVQLIQEFDSLKGEDNKY